MAQRSMGGKSREQPEGGVAPSSKDILWAKYLDYCSARVCDVFMQLGEEQVFELARGVEHEAGAGQGELSFRQITALLVDKLLGDLPLPDFESWAESYQSSPEEYDPHLLGLWRTTIKPPTTSSKL